MVEGPSGGGVMFRDLESLRPPFLAYHCSFRHCKEKKRRLGPRWQGMAMFPSQAVPTPAHRKTEKRMEGGREEGAIIGVGAKGSDRIKYTRMNNCVGTTSPAPSKLRGSEKTCFVCPFSRQKEQRHGEGTLTWLPGRL